MLIWKILCNVKRQISWTLSFFSLYFLLVVSIKKNLYLIVVSERKESAEKKHSDSKFKEEKQ